MNPTYLECNPEDGEWGGGDAGMVKTGLRWLFGKLERHEVYGEDSEVALQVMMSDVTAAHRAEIKKRYLEEGADSGWLSSNSIAEMDSKIAQFRKDIRSIVTDDQNIATAGLGSYTAKYKILRANRLGIKARITIENPMTVSSFAHIATGYGTPSSRFVKRWFDNDGIVAFEGAGRRHDMTITFRTVIPCYC
ncbi:hypothetical protein [Streptomyces sp. NPDC051286]|uniref:hypothetical protein n=1 Tax=Streptomyces sp. NPDC051286 TaxID=3365647 RepID=UPI003788D71D